ncbi:hypothetical protein GO730_34775 [Spirosoma sp. HMF3257]|uniref:Uncharacterized protein n=1 Tax=Spirosoma telluris TaxID=2183553 RepID=A0A327NTR6_9BACT|nr:hypothetical protein [Spirosoma telluris]RAI77963.1 hypothetical protein HMF3257_34675 [Spirosoma telluris]
MTGYFHGTATFGNTTLSTTGTDDSDIFVAKYDASGSLLWARRAGAVLMTRVMALLSTTVGSM